MATMAALKVGDPFDEKTELGPLATKDGVNPSISPCEPPLNPAANS